MRLRESVRALIVDPRDRVLLVRFDWHGLEPPGGFWANPGGGVEPGETRLAALRRELREEVGLEIDELGAEVWTKTAMFAMPDWDGQVDHVHLCRTEAFDPDPDLTPEQLAAEHVHEIRWWSAEELARTDATFAPRSMPSLVRSLVRDGVPSSPVSLQGF